MFTKFSAEQPYPLCKLAAGTYQLGKDGKEHVHQTLVSILHTLLTWAISEPGIATVAFVTCSIIVPYVV